MTYPASHAAYPSYSPRRPFSSQQTPQPQGQPSQHAQPQYPKQSYPHNPLLQTPVKVEDPAELPSVSSLTGAYDHHNAASSSSIFRFGTNFPAGASPSSPTSNTSFPFMSQQNWQPPASTSYSHSSSQHNQHTNQHYGPVDRYGVVSPANAQTPHGLALTDDYDDDGADELPDLPSGIPLAAYTAGSAKSDKQVRRRSSKACDQCRKSKCKCERSTTHEPCRNCLLLGTQCTFLGPSRKRGPPKGYIDAIEARLHQTEALIGILLSSKDSRAKGVLQDLAQDPLAKEIINRVDNSPYGFKGRSRGAEAPTSRARAPAEHREGDGTTVHATHPSSEWQDQVILRLNNAAASRNALLHEGPVAAGLENPDIEHASRPASVSARRYITSQSQTPVNISTRRQRRRLDDLEPDDLRRSASSASSRSPLMHRALEEVNLDASEESGEDEIALAVGQLSMNEDQQVRFHGKMSGLHLLGVKELKDGRNQGGIWRFPKARVWPPLSPALRNSQRRQSDNPMPQMPDVSVQELLLELYFTYVHPAFPIVHKGSFLEDFRKGNLNLVVDSPYSGESGSDTTSLSVSSLRSRRRPVPTVLLLAMFALAARYSSQTADVPPDDGSMWSAGDQYMEDAKVILDRTYAASRPSTCQALLLLGYREVGIGAMAQAWLYIGMAVRMAQDLGLHKRADEWTSVGRNLFTKAELQERRRIWYGCVIMDKYVSTYIGRPVAIREPDFDTELPVEEEGEEMELWKPHPSPQVQVTQESTEATLPEVSPLPGHTISCFNEAAKLSIIISEICQIIYAIRSSSSRAAELSRLDSKLMKWSLELPEYLRFDPASPKNPPPPPHILTLHMQFWCTVLLLHRPFQEFTKPLSPAASKEADVRSRKHYDICVQAANHITLIVSIYCDNYSARRASVFLCYYVFTAAIMHVASLRMYREDSQAVRGLDRCMDMMKRMSLVWPSAWRALELLNGAKAEIEMDRRPGELPAASRLPASSEATRYMHKRAAEEEDSVEDVDIDETRHAYRQADYAVVPSHESSARQEHGYAMHMDGPPSSSYMQPSYDRWAAAAAAAADGSLADYGASLSTSVLQQQYSTGLVDVDVDADETANTSMSRDSERRYPAYWNDYSALGQMETTYGVSVPVLEEMVSQHGHGHGPTQTPGGGDQRSHPQQQSQSMYAPHQYSMFGSLPPTGQQ